MLVHCSERAARGDSRKRDGAYLEASFSRFTSVVIVQRGANQGSMESNPTRIADMRRSRRRAAHAPPSSRRVWVEARPSRRTGGRAGSAMVAALIEVPLAREVG